MKNYLFSIISIFIFFSLFFGFLNLVFSGVPLFNLFKISISDAIYHLKDEKNKSNYEINFSKDYYVSKCGKTENGFYNLAYKQDKFGFRENNENLFYNTDIVILGDSFGISSCVNSPNDLTSKLIKKTNNKKILNISVGGTGPLYQKEMIVNLFNKNNTKFNTLIWLFYEGNDHEDINRNYGKNFNFDFKKVTNNSDIEVTYTSFTPNSLMKFKLFISNYLRGFGTLVKYLETYPKLIQNESYYDEVVKSMNEFLIKNNVHNKILYYIPKYTRLAYKDIPHPQLRQLDDLKRLVERTSLKYGFKFIDGSITYHNKKEPLNFFHYKLPTHFNIMGYDLLAEELARNLNN